MLSNFIEITLRHGCSPVNLLHIFRTPFLKNTYGVIFLLFIVFVGAVKFVRIVAVAVETVVQLVEKTF